MSFCTRCGKENHDGANFCEYCGTKLDIMYDYFGRSPTDVQNNLEWFNKHFNMKKSSILRECND